jgi:DNA-binding transcriptional ArsR family regulator
LTIVNTIVNYYRVHDVDATAGTVIEALSDPTRRRIVTLLSDGPKRAGELAAEVGMSAPAMSRHLRVLLSALVIADERLDEDARARVFRLKPESIKTTRAWLGQLVPGGTGPGGTGPGGTGPGTPAPANQHGENIDSP